MKRGFSLIVLVALAQPVHAGSQQSTNHHQLEGFYQRTGLYEFHGVPLHVRQVPRHRDDGYLGVCPTAIEQDHVGSRSWMFGIRYTFAVPLKVFALKVGPTLYIDRVNNLRPPVNPEERERLYARYRAGGNCWRYYQVIPKMPAVTPRILFGISIPRGSEFEETKLRLTGGIELDPLGLPLIVETGWDRFNHDEVWRYFTAGRFREHSVFLRLELGGPVNDQEMHLFLEGGYPWGSFSPKKGFSEMTMENRTSPRVGLGVGLTL